MLHHWYLFWVFHQLVVRWVYLFVKCCKGGFHRQIMLNCLSITTVLEECLPFFSVKRLCLQRKLFYWDGPHWTVNVMMLISSIFFKILALETINQFHIVSQSIIFFKLLNELFLLTWPTIIFGNSNLACLLKSHFWTLFLWYNFFRYYNMWVIAFKFRLFSDTVHLP